MKGGLAVAVAARWLAANGMWGQLHSATHTPTHPSALLTQVHYRLPVAGAW